MTALWKTFVPGKNILIFGKLAILILPCLLLFSSMSIADDSNGNSFSDDLLVALQDSGSETAGVTGSDTHLNPNMMSTLHKQAEDERMRSRLSTLWTAVTLNMIAADVLTLYIPEAMEEWDDYADGKESELMLGGAIMYQVPVSMVFLSKILPHNVNRWTNIIAAGAMSGAVLAGGESEPHYWVFAGVEVIGMGLIAWNAWNWENPDDDGAIQNFNMGFNADKESFGVACSFNFQL